MRTQHDHLLLGLATALLTTACATSAVEEPEQEAGSGMMAELEALSITEKLELVEELRLQVDRELLTPDAELLREHATLVATDGVSVNRILNRGLFDGSTLGRGGGAYFSFTSLTNDYDQDPDLELQQGCLSSGFYGGNWGHVVRLDADSLLDVELDDLPAELRADVPPPRARKRPEAVVPGAVYAVRSIRLDESDLLVALQVLGRDDHGVTFAWRTMREYAVPLRR